MKVNLNTKTTIVLRKRGVEIYNAYHRNLGVDPLKVVSVGDRYTGELWDIMNIFGSSCYMGSDLPFNIDLEIDITD